MSEAYFYIGTAAIIAAVVIFAELHERFGNGEW